MLDKAFDPAAAEPRLYEAWETSGVFKPSGEGKPFTIVIPPPNVTGSLHMGHALNNTLQDVLCRFERMRGRSVLWQPGTDHAGIATQMVVEREMAKRQEPRRTEIGREKFLEKVWAWKAESGGAIISQLKRLGASCDWSRERFTMDEGLSEAVKKVFVQLYREGLIYRDKRLVNWDPKLVTAISDLEVENTEVSGHFWHFKYPLEGGDTYEFPIAYDESGNPTEWETRDYISIATTRPETMLGDGAVAVHPSDKRYAPIVGKKCLLPLADRYIPIITDDYPDPDFGSGAVKITGAHDFNDYKVAQRNNIKLYILMDERARMLDADYIPEKYRGLDRFEARKQVVADIEERGLLIKVEDKKIMQPFGDRSNVVIEPMLTDQWYVDAQSLAKKAIDAVSDGETKFVPENWTKTYFQWMYNIEPWCVSRQLWWGHQIPAWYGPDGHVYVAESEEEATKEAIRRLTAEGYSLEDINNMRRHEGGEGPLLVRDEDVLDTWFSSALWPFSTLGWPGETPELGKHYPTDVLVTAHDIIFFWVARMMMMGTHFMKKVPFRDVYIHALVLDEKGQKMSKSKGNVIDPLILIDKYGADALRFTLAAMAAQGRNIRLSEARVEGYRNFGTKLWNAARFCEMNGCAFDASFKPSAATQTLNRWIIHEAGLAAAEATAALETYRFNDAAGAIYRFVWNVFCDWHLELAKPILLGPDSAAKAETQKATAFVLSQILKLLHPFMPFVTEELWRETASREKQLAITAWPASGDFPSSDKAAAEINWVIGLISAIRSARAEMNVPAGAKISMMAVGADAQGSLRIDANRELISRLARLDEIHFAASSPKGAVQIVHEGAVYALPLAGVIDIEAEKARLRKEFDKCAKEIETIDKKMSNPNFVDKAPPEVVEENRERRIAFVERQEKLAAALTQISQG
ncbi:MAG: valine--tRNA ligase [Alphaproteobacteria bacterium RIFCSPHIGHO2_12_FULL_63_12]|nr:MAG: valine--tRNA ligase [Alphaproteobacteria bacterium RIFCSPHIGHO2_12_FULL_63_12]